MPLSLEQILQSGTTTTSPDPHKQHATPAEVPPPTGTGAIPPVRLEERVVPFDNLEIVVCIDDIGRFVGVHEVRVKKDFLSPEQRVSSSGNLDVEEFYAE